MAGQSLSHVDAQAAGLSDAQRLAEHVFEVFTFDQ